MANIQPEIEQISQAQYGEQVRGAICEGLQKINDDNNSYNDLKKVVLDKADQAQTILDTFHQDLETEKVIIDDFNQKVSSADQLKKDLDEAFNKVVDATDILEQSKEIKENLEEQNSQAQEFLESFLEIKDNIEKLQNELKEAQEQYSQIDDLVEKALFTIEDLKSLVNDAGLIDLVALTKRMEIMEQTIDGIPEILNKLL